jgi:hypothetical protein
VHLCYSRGVTGPRVSSRSQSRCCRDEGLIALQIERKHLCGTVGVARALLLLQSVRFGVSDSLSPPALDHQPLCGWPKSGRWRLMRHPHQAQAATGKLQAPHRPQLGHLHQDHSKSGLSYPTLRRLLMQMAKQWIITTHRKAPQLHTLSLN